MLLVLLAELFSEVWCFWYFSLSQETSEALLNKVFRRFGFCALNTCCVAPSSRIDTSWLFSTTLWNDDKRAEIMLLYQCFPICCFHAVITGATDDASTLAKLEEARGVDVGVDASQTPFGERSKRKYYYIKIRIARIVGNVHIIRANWRVRISKKRRKRGKEQSTHPALCCFAPHRLARRAQWAPRIPCTRNFSSPNAPLSHA